MCDILLNFLSVRIRTYLVMDLVGSCTQMDVLLCFGIFTALLVALYSFICVLGQVFALFNSVGLSLVDLFRGGGGG